MVNLNNYINQLRQCKDNILYIDEHIDKYIKMQQLHYRAVTLVNEGITSELYSEKPIIVSLTSYGVRLQKAYLAIESMMSQTIRPNKIVLSISEKIEYKNLPELLKKQETRGLEINFCRDVRSFTKLIPVLKKYPDSVIITIDDDMLYPDDFIEYLVKAYNNNPNKIYFYYGYKMFLDKNGQPASYDKWVGMPAKDSSILNLPTGVDGILYPPNCFHDDICNDKIFLKFCPNEDDLWFKVMTMLRDMECETVLRALMPRKEFIPLPTSSVNSLRSVNSVRRNSDKQFMNLFEYYNLSKYF